MEVTNYFNDTGLVALNAQEMKTIEGGFISSIIDFIAGFIQGVRDAYNRQN